MRVEIGRGEAVRQQIEQRDGREAVGRRGRGCASWGCATRTRPVPFRQLVRPPPGTHSVRARSSASEHPLVPETVADIAVWGLAAAQIDLHLQSCVVALAKDGDGWWTVPGDVSSGCVPAGGVSATRSLSTAVTRSPTHGRCGCPTVWHGWSQADTPPAPAPRRGGRSTVR